MRLAPFLYLYLPESLDFLIRSRADPGQIQAVLARIDPAAVTTGAVGFEIESADRKNAVAESVSVRAHGGHAFAFGGFRPQPCGILRAAKLAAADPHQPELFYRLGGANDVANHYRRHCRGLRRRPGDGSAFAVWLARNPLSRRRRVCRAHRMGAVAFPLDADDRFVLCRLLRQWRAKERDCADGNLYPAPIRSTGVGWALGIGRIGGIAGPLLIGALLGWQVQPASVFYAATLPMLASALIIVLLGVKYGGGRQPNEAFSAPRHSLRT